MTGEAQGAVGAITHQEVRRLLVDRLVVRIVAAAALDVAIDQLHRLRLVGGGAGHHQSFHQAGRVFQGKLQAEGVRRIQPLHQAGRHRLRHRDRTIGNHLPGRDRAIVAAQAQRAAVIDGGLHLDVLRGVAGIELRVVLGRKSLIPQGLGSTGVRRMAVQAGRRHRPSHRRSCRRKIMHSQHIAGLRKRVAGQEPEYPRDKGFLHGLAPSTLARSP